MQRILVQEPVELFVLEERPLEKFEGCLVLEFEENRLASEA